MPSRIEEIDEYIMSWYRRRRRRWYDPDDDEETDLIYDELAIGGILDDE